MENKTSVWRKNVIMYICCTIILLYKLFLKTPMISVEKSTFCRQLNSWIITFWKLRTVVLFFHFELKWASYGHFKILKLSLFEIKILKWENYYDIIFISLRTHYCSNGTLLEYSTKILNLFPTYEFAHGKTIDNCSNAAKSHFRISLSSLRYNSI